MKRIELKYSPLLPTIDTMWLRPADTDKSVKFVVLALDLLAWLHSSKDLEVAIGPVRK